MNKKNLTFQIALTQVDGVGDALARMLVAHYGSAEEVFGRKAKELSALGVPAVVAKRLSVFNDFGRAQQEVEFISRQGIQAWCYSDEVYPKRLKHIPDAPFMLYYQGNATLDQSRVIAIVGTRKATPYGREFCRSLLSDLAHTGCLVLSGLAYGIDLYAHRAALDAGLPTVAVLGHGLDRIYPRAHYPISREMLANGGLLTENISGTDPERQHFPKRNRIVAGLCDACIVVESAVKGGAIITAGLAGSYNRDVLALPGRTGDPYSAGCNMLIKTHQAHMIEHAADLYAVLGWDKDQPSGSVQRRMFNEITGVERQVVDLIYEASRIGIDDLFIQSHIPMSELSLLLLDLECKGIVRALPGKAYEVAG